MIKASFTTYEILDGVLGDGGCGKVVRGMDSTTREVVAIKVVDNSRSRAYERECEIIKRVSNLPYVCKVFYMTQKEQMGYIVMKKYNCDLFEYILESGKIFSEKRIARIFKKICIGVREMHKLSIAHLDIKPENILVDICTETPFFCDFGNSIVVTKDSNDSQSPSLEYFPTQLYCPPEVFDSSQKYDLFKVDIYALGVTLHVLLTAHFPWREGGNTLAGIMTHCNEVPLSSSCVSLLEGMLATNIDQRWNINKVLSCPWLQKSPGTKKYLRKIKRCGSTL